MASYVPSDTYRRHLREVISPEPNPKKKCRRGRTRVSLVNRRDRTTFCCSDGHISRRAWNAFLSEYLLCYLSPLKAVNSKRLMEFPFLGGTKCVHHALLPWQAHSEWTRKDFHQSEETMHLKDEGLIFCAEFKWCMCPHKEHRNHFS